MRKLVLSVAVALATLSATAQQSGLSLKNRVAIQRMKFERATTPFTLKADNFSKSRQLFGKTSNYVSAITRLAEGKTADDLKAEGVHVLRSIGDFAFIAMPLDDAERVASLPFFNLFEFEKKVDHKMYFARQATGVNDIHQGIGLTQAYTGKGVVCGIVDNGFDINHANFLDENGEPRVKYFEIVSTNSNATSSDDYFIFKTYNTPEDIKKVTTDNNQTYHGTHTMGIMAGGYRGKTKAAVFEESGSGLTAAVKEGIANPYYGMAYESDIIAGTASNMSNMEIAQAVADLAYYEEYAKQPVVINLSLGSNSGAHDGSSAECQVFDMLAKELGSKIIVAAGNEGDMKLALKKTLSAGNTTMGSFVTGTSYTDNEGTEHYMRYGGIEIYSTDLSRFKKISVKIWNTQRNRVAKTFSITPSDDNVGTGMYYCSSGYEEMTGGTYDATFGKYFEGYIGLGWGLDPNTNKPYALIDIATLDNPLGNSTHAYIIGFEVEGEEGQRFEAYATGEVIYGLESNGIAGWDDGTRNGTISDMATGQHTLCVGSFTTINGWPQLDGGIYTQTNPDQTPVLIAGKVSNFSSYGTLSDGRNLPHVLGPGAYMISSMNRYYLQAAGATGREDILTAIAETTNRDPYVWSAGTSMACPAVAGIVALWLEADPTLKMDDIKDIIATTSKKSDDMIDEAPEQIGAGLIDAYAGLKEVLRRKGSSGIKNISSEENRLVVTADGDRKVKVFVAGEESLNIEVFSVSGVRVAQTRVNGDEGMVDLTGNAKGTYVIRVNGRLSKCVLVK